METVKFSKYQGIGNDFILIDCRENLIAQNLLNLDRKIIQRLCDRNYGIGADGVIFALTPTNDCHIRMKIINSDSSEPEMCGNGIRCLVKFLVDTDEVTLNTKKIFDIETLSGILSATYELNNLITVNMGLPRLTPSEIPTKLNLSSSGLPSGKIEIENHKLTIYSVGMGNPHLITFVENIDSEECLLLGKYLEVNHLFPNKTNVHFVQVINSETIKLFVWERGCGPTLACGTGACAAVVACTLLQMTSNQVEVQLPGGDLLIRWPGHQQPVYMTGSAELTFKGQFQVKM